MSLLYRALVPRGVSKVLNPVDLPSARGILTPRAPRRRKSTRKRSTSRKSAR